MAVEGGGDEEYEMKETKSESKRGEAEVVGLPSSTVLLLPTSLGRLVM